jgi:hypothetical protein
VTHVVEEVARVALEAEPAGQFVQTDMPVIDP